jgi:hypothetical protein
MVTEFKGLLENNIQHYLQAWQRRCNIHIKSEGKYPEDDHIHQRFFFFPWLHSPA